MLEAKWSLERESWSFWMIYVLDQSRRAMYLTERASGNQFDKHRDEHWELCDAHTAFLSFQVAWYLHIQFLYASLHKTRASLS